MLTDTQKKTFKDLNDGKKLSPKQKADFYYRMSNILKDKLEDTKYAMYLLNVLPDSYLEKIDLSDAATSSMQLSETILKKMSLPQVQPNFQMTELNAVKSYDLGPDNFKPPEGMPFTVYGCSIFRDLDKNEAKTIAEILRHIRALKDALTPKRETVSATEFNTRISPQIHTEAEKKKITCRVVPDFTDILNSLDILLKTAEHIEERERLDRLYPNLKQATDAEK